VKIPPTIRTLVGLVVNADGSITFAGKLIARGLDLTSYGSGNPAAANMIRWLDLSDNTTPLAELYSNLVGGVPHLKPALWLVSLVRSITGNALDSSRVQVRAQSAVTGGFVDAVLLDGNGASDWVVAPAVEGSPGAFLETDGAGGRSWASVATSIVSRFRPADPTGTTNTTGLMAGLGGTFHYTPTTTGKLLITVSGNAVGAASGGPNTQLRYGTGAAPANAAALTGTATGTTAKSTGGGTTTVPFSISEYVTGLVVGTAYWFDLSVASNGGGSVSVKDLTVLIQEL
jgi:hypothetical protein